VIDWSAIIFSFEPESSIIIIVISIITKEAGTLVVFGFKVVKGNGSVKVRSSDDIVLALGCCLAPI